MLLARAPALRLARRRVAVGMQADVLRAPAQQQVERKQQHGGDERERQAGPAPAVARDQDLHPRQQHDRADADAGECDADREPAPPHEPVRNELRLHAVAEEIAADADQHAEREHRNATARARASRAQGRARSPATPISTTSRGPLRSISRPTNGLMNAETKNPNEKMPATTPRSQPNSSRIGGNSSENAVRALTPIAHGDEGRRDDDPAIEDRQAREARAGGGRVHRGSTQEQPRGALRDLVEREPSAAAVPACRSSSPRRG